MRWKVPASQKENPRQKLALSAHGLGLSDSRAVSKCLSVAQASQTWSFAVTAWVTKTVCRRRLVLEPDPPAASALHPQRWTSHKLALSAVFT